MKRAVISLEEAIKQANKRLLPAGIKPEDYLIVGDDIPLRIAKMVIKEARHIIYMDKKNERTKR
jgi:hypothetical protein